MALQLDDGRPIFQQVAHELTRRIARGDLPLGEKLPTVREMALEFRVNPNTIQRACQELERQGVISSRRGHGIFVTESPVVLRELRQAMVAEAVAVCQRELRALGLDCKRMQAAFSAALDEEAATDRNTRPEGRETE